MTCGTVVIISATSISGTPSSGYCWVVSQTNSNVWDMDPDLIIPLADYINSNFTVAVWNLQDQIRPSISYDGSDTDRIASLAM